MPEQSGEKTHDATPHRRQQARDQGQVARSQDLSSAIILLGTLLVIAMVSANARDEFAGMAADRWAMAQSVDASPEFFLSLWYGVIRLTGALLLPLFGTLFVIALFANIGQTGFLWVPQKLALDWSRLSIIKGLQRIFSLAGLMRLSFGIFKILVIAIVAGVSLWSEREVILALCTRSTVEIANYIVHTVWWTCLKIGIALLILAILDYAYQRWKQEQEMRMTDQELRDELKTTQGDPQIAARRRAVQRQLVLNRLGSVVPTADFVVTNPTELAIAIRYDHEQMVAPTVIAKGAGVLAARIRTLALENGIPVIERKPLARALYQQVEVNEPVPEEHYGAVAEILRYVYELQGRTLPT